MRHATRRARAQRRKVALRAAHVHVVRRDRVRELDAPSAPMRMTMAMPVPVRWVQRRDAAVAGRGRPGGARREVRPARWRADRRDRVRAVRRGRVIRRRRVVCDAPAAAACRCGCGRVVRVARERRARRRAPVLASSASRLAREERRSQRRELHPRAPTAAIPISTPASISASASEPKPRAHARRRRRARARPAARRVAPRAVRDRRGEQLGLRACTSLSADRSRARQRARAATLLLLLLLGGHTREGHRPPRVRPRRDARAHARARRVEAVQRCESC